MAQTHEAVSRGARASLRAFWFDRPNYGITKVDKPLLLYLLDGSLDGDEIAGAWRTFFGRGREK